MIDESLTLKELELFKEMLEGQKIVLNKPYPRVYPYIKRAIEILREREYNSRKTTQKEEVWTCCGGIELSKDEKCKVCGDSYL